MYVCILCMHILGIDNYVVIVSAIFKIYVDFQNSIPQYYVAIYMKNWMMKKNTNRKLKSINRKLKIINRKLKNIKMKQSYTRNKNNTM